MLPLVGLPVTFTLGRVGRARTTGQHIMFSSSGSRSMLGFDISGWSTGYMIAVGWRGAANGPLRRVR